MKAAHIETEQRCKAVKTETLTKAREEQQAYLRQLFPSVKVDSSEFSKWLDEFEVKVEEVLKDYSDKVRISRAQWNLSAETRTTPLIRRLSMNIAVFL